MSDQNKAILMQANAAIANGDYEGFLVYCSDDTQWNFVGDKILYGKEAVREWMRVTYLEPPKFMVSNIVAEDDFVIAMGKIAVRQPDGTTVQSEYCDVWSFKEGRMHVLNAYVVEVKSEL
ncbi:MAG: nuclear transport factor 2 family protein [Chitinophagaceae bacterium]|nr:MAG: nuclear transport factor 2 family protein [Chitinophagaceae bacterium]